MSPAGELVPERLRGERELPTQEPPVRVFVHDDDVTPMDFVVHILMNIFELPRINAEQVMLTAHLTGRAYVVTLPAPEARRRVQRAHFAASLRQLPLRFTLVSE